PSGITALVDGGGYRRMDEQELFNAGRDVIVPHLRRQGIRRVDVVVVSHAHDDHLAGLLPVLEQLDVGMVVDNGQPGTTPVWESYTALVAARDVPRVVVRAGHVIALDERTILEVLHPPRDLLVDGGGGLNHNALVLRLRYGDTSLLLTGELEIAGQWYLLTSGADLRADVVKVPHHGSRLSLVSSLYRAVGARAAVIPVGTNNYGHPHPDVVETLLQHGLAVYRTDVHGAVRWL